MDIEKLLGDDAPVAEFQFQEDAWLTLRFVSAEELRAIHRKATRTRFNAKHQAQEVLDSEEANRLLAEAAVVGWRGITSGGSVVPFSAEVRDTMMARWLTFRTFVNEKATEFSEFVEAEREKSRGNSSRTSGPDATIQP